MNENYEITKQQLYILIAASAFLACLFVLLGIVIGKNYELPRPAPSAKEIAEKMEVKDGEIIFPDDIPDISVQHPSASKKPYIENDEYVFYEKMKSEEIQGKESVNDDLVTNAQPMIDRSEMVSKQTREDPVVNEKLNEAYAIQVGAFTNKSSADNTTEDLRNKGYYVNIFPKKFKSGNVVHQVRVGRYRTKIEALKVKEKLEKEEHLSTWIVKTMFN